MCSRASADYSYSDEGQAALLSACPLSCGDCTAASNTEDLCTDDSVFTDEHGYPCTDWAIPSFVCTEATSVHGYTSAGQTALLEACPASCDGCPEPTLCYDDADFVDSTNGLPCSAFAANPAICSVLASSAQILASCRLSLSLIHI